MISSIHIIGAKMFGGAEKFFVRLVNALHEAGHPVLAIIPHDALIDDNLDATVPRKFVKMRSVYDIVSRYQIKKAIREINPDIVQTYMGRATRLTRINPASNSTHIARLGGYYNLKGYRHAHAWVGNTQGICQYLRDKGLAESSVFYAGNFVEPVTPPTPEDRLRIREQYRIPAETTLLLAVGRLHSNKAIDTLLNAFALLPKEINNRELHLLVAGAGPERENLQALAHKLKIDPRIYWAGWQMDTTSLYHSCDLFICPSRHEPLGNVILEAWSCQAAVISTRSAGALELIEDKKNGILTAIDKPQELADAIVNTLTAPPTFINTLTQTATKTLISNHSKKTIVKRYLTIYQTLINTT